MPLWVIEIGSDLLITHIEVLNSGLWLGILSPLLEWVEM